VIQITAELLGCDPSILNSDDTATSAAGHSETASSSYSASATSYGKDSTATGSTARTAIKWKTGDRCLAPWNEDGKYVHSTGHREHSMVSFRLDTTNAQSMMFSTMARVRSSTTDLNQHPCLSFECVSNLS
jgi:hypothetical protein